MTKSIKAQEHIHHSLVEYWYVMVKAFHSRMLSSVSSVSS